MVADTASSIQLSMRAKQSCGDSWMVAARTGLDREGVSVRTERKRKEDKNSVEQRRAEHVSDEQDAKLRVLPLVSGDVGKQKGRTRIIDKADEMAGFFM